MSWLSDLYQTQPFWIWLAVGAVILVMEVATGTGWLLWPAACAALMAALTLVLPGGPEVDVAVYGVITIAATVLARRYLPRNAAGDGPDINDNVGRLVGKHGLAVAGFENGQGRVFIDGKEWAAVAEGEAPAGQQQVEVLAAEGAVLRVKVF